MQSKNKSKNNMAIDLNQTDARSASVWQSEKGIQEQKETTAEKRVEIRQRQKKNKGSCGHDSVACKKHVHRRHRRLQVHDEGYYFPFPCYHRSERRGSPYKELSRRERRENSKDKWWLQGQGAERFSGGRRDKHRFSRADSGEHRAGVQDI